MLLRRGSAEAPISEASGVYISHCKGSGDSKESDLFLGPQTPSTAAGSEQGWIDPISYSSSPRGPLQYACSRGGCWESFKPVKESILLKVSIWNTNTLAQSAWNTVIITKSLLLLSFVPFEGRRRHTCAFASYQSAASGGHGARFNFLNRRSNWKGNRQKNWWVSKNNLRQKYHTHIFLFLLYSKQSYAWWANASHFQSFMLLIQD